MTDQSANAGSEQTGDQTTDETGKKVETKDNNKNNDDNLETLWDNPVEDTSKTVAPDPNLPAQQQQQQPDANEAFNEHIKSLDLVSGLDLSEISTELNQGNTEALNKAFTHMASNIYRQSMINASKIIDKKVQEGVDKAVKSSANAVQGNMAVDKMQAALSFTKQPAISPVATAVLAQLIKKGKSVDDAINGVRTFFKQTAHISAKELGLNQPPRSRPGQQPFNNNIIDTDEEAETDWMETLNI